MRGEINHSSSKLCTISKPRYKSIAHDRYGKRSMLWRWEQPTLPFNAHKAQCRGTSGSRSVTNPATGKRRRVNHGAYQCTATYSVFNTDLFCWRHLKVDFEPMFNWKWSNWQRKMILRHCVCRISVAIIALLVSFQTSSKYLITLVFTSP